MDDGEEAAGTRATQVCRPCRLRHKKCDWDDEICGQCQINGLECVRQSTFRFRYDPKQKALAGASPASQQWWPRPNGPLTFYDETPELQELYTGLPVAQSLESQEIYATPLMNPSPIAHPPSSGGSALAAYLSPPNEQTSPRTVLSAQQQCTAGQHLTTSEAILVRNFADNMAQWTDIADAERTFEFEVPRRALTDPLLRHAICAFSARHYHRRSSGEEGERGQAEALDHQNKCLELLIPAMSGGQITESILAAVAVLRQNEEMDEHDYLFHLEGCSRILNMVPDFAIAGGLGEAAAWLCLREDMYISLTTQSQMNVQLDSFLECGWIRRDDDQSWASKSVLNLAFLLTRSFGETADEEGLRESEAEIAQWNRSRPASYHPIHSKARSQRDDRHFPEIWTLTPYAAVGLQYYHIAQIVLNVMRLRANTDAKPYDRLLESRARERQIRHHLLVVVGLAISNPRAENTWYTARHCLSVWAGCLRKQGDQQAALRFLEDMGHRTGWRISGLIESLRQQWEEDSGSG